jgi:hypothetical protein
MWFPKTLNMRKQEEHSTMKTGIALTALCLIVSSARLSAQKKGEASPSPAPFKQGWQLSGSWRVRSEFWNWFPTDKARNDYNFEASVLRLGVMRQTKRDEIMLEIEQPTLIGLPTGSTASAPQGQLGLGSSYRASSGTQSASLFLKQGYLTFKNVGRTGNDLKLGRYEFSDGMELPSANPSLAYLKRERIGQRLIGPFGFTHVGRSFDGILVSSTRPHVNTTFLWAFPTRGVFSVRGMDTLTDVQVAYLSRTTNHTSKSVNTDSRLFTAFYDDSRKGVVKTDNRPLAVRTADTQGIKIGTIGGHALGVHQVGGGKIDLMAWGAGQFGSWGSQQHKAYAYALEAGFQPDKVASKPWFRVGYYYASGDGNGANSTHGTFFPMLPTPRIYARFPFYSETNLEDFFGQVVLRPSPKWTVRCDVHGLGLADANDLWYSGGGAFDSSSFGYAGRPSGGNRRLGVLYDLSLDYQAHKNLTISLYLGYTRGGNVVSSIYQGKDATFGYAEFTYRF